MWRPISRKNPEARADQLRSVDEVARSRPDYPHSSRAAICSEWQRSGQSRRQAEMAQHKHLNAASSPVPTECPTDSIVAYGARELEKLCLIESAMVAGTTSHVEAQAQL